jgi:hypothetical protein
MTALGVLKLSCISFQIRDLHLLVPNLPSIHTLHLQDCREMRASLNMEPLRRLTRLQLQQCPGLQVLQLCTSLQTPLVKGCEAPTELQAPTKLGTSQGCCLQRLEVQDCPLRGGISGLQLLSSLTRLQLRQCNALEQLQLGSSLKELLLEGCQALSAIQASPGQCAPQQDSVHDHPCAQLPNSLTRMELLQCPALTQLHFGSSLKQLQVKDCQALSALQAPRGSGLLPPNCSLQQLTLHSCPLGAVTDLQLLSNLTQLEVQGCDALRLLQLGRRLKRLLVTDCGSLAEIRGLAAAAPQEQQQQQTPPAQPTQLQAMQLRRLKVLNCGLLKPPHCLRHLASLQHVTYHMPDGMAVEWQRHVDGSNCPRPLECIATRSRSVASDDWGATMDGWGE